MRNTTTRPAMRSHDDEERDKRQEGGRAEEAGGEQTKIEDVELLADYY
jgi:hypothetical protein